MYITTSDGKDAICIFDAERQRYKNVSNNLSTKSLFLDYKYYARKYGATVADYFMYSFYDKDEAKIGAYITERRRCEMYDYADKKEYNHIMGDKKDFYKEYLMILVTLGQHSCNSRTAFL